MTFEEALEQLEIIVKKLESGTIKLEESISLYQKGLELYGQCYQKLQDAEKLIVKINGETESE
ncbi:MAG: Exodeoxyribonuclease small subunit [Haloplasmataceae bacterium]|jgi:exodeoxyribonuclease VII small subunit|nr:Exodeoxyribonuclease small subunit [Haloplasmataceae bacterium]